MKRLIAVFLIASLAALSAKAAGVGMTLMLDTPGEWKHVAYACEDQDQRLSVAYVNAAPNYLALVPVEGETLIFAGVLAASGVRYASGRYEWWTKGQEASLRDITADPDGPAILTCIEASDIP